MPERGKALTVTNVIIAINVIVFLAEYLGPVSLYRTIDAQALTTSVVYTGAWYTLITSMFMHGGLMHILCNMITLYWVGSILEHAYGPVKFTVLYFVSGIAGGLVFVYINLAMGQPASAVGASGAIFGLFGAYIYLLWRESRHNVIYVRPVAKSDVTSMLSLLVINVLIGFTPGIAWQAHFGGFFAGLVLGIIIYALQAAKVKRIMASERQKLEEAQRNANFPR